MIRPIASALLLAAIVAACDSNDQTFPVSVAPASRHDDLRAALTMDAQGFSFANGQWVESQGDAPFYGTAWLARTNTADPRLFVSNQRSGAFLATNLSTGDLGEKIFVVLGLIEYVAATGDQSSVSTIDTFLDLLDTAMAGANDYLDVGMYGPTVATALAALANANYALTIDSARTHDRLNRAISLEQTLTDVALTDLVDTESNAQTRGYAASTASGALDLVPNAVMMLLEARLYRLTRGDTYLLEARAVYGAVQLLKLSDAPARYATPGDADAHLATLASQNYLALGLLGLFEITGEEHFVDEADAVLDGIEQMRGPWCLAQIDNVGCTPVCASGQACVDSACIADRCTTGLLYDITDGTLPTSGRTFCSGCSLQTLFVLGERRLLANEPF